MDVIAASLTAVWLYSTPKKKIQYSPFYIYSIAQKEKLCGKAIEQSFN